MSSPKRRNRITKPARADRRVGEVIVRETRREARSHFDETTRVSLLEGDMDLSEINTATFQREIRDEVRSMKMMMLGVIISAATATIVGAINLVMGRIG